MVAASGTALGSQQMGLLKKLDVQRLVLLFDADDAGQSAARKGVDAALDAGLAPYAVSLPEGADPDSFVRQFGADAFRSYLRDERLDFVAFLVGQARQSGALSTPEGKSGAVSEVLATIKRLGSPIQAGEYLKRAADALDVYESDLRRQFEGQAAPRRRPPPVDDEQPTAPAPDPVPEVRPEESSLIRLMLEQGAPMVEHVLTRMGVDEFSPGPSREVVEALIGQFEAGAIEVAPFVRGDHGDDVRVLVQDALSERHGLSDNWHGKVGINPKHRDDNPFASAASSMRLLKLDRVDEAVREAMTQMQSLERAGQDITELQGHVNGLNDLRRQIERGEFMEWTGEG